MQSTPARRKRRRPRKDESKRRGGAGVSRAIERCEQTGGEPPLRRVSVRKAPETKGKCRRGVPHGAGRWGRVSQVSVPVAAGLSRDRDELEALRALAGDLGIVVDLDGTVSAMDAARLLGRARPRSTWRPGACIG